MKKYLRTKEHIYKRLFIDKAIINECGVGACDKDLNPIGEQIIKESDELEELCDEFVMVTKYNHFQIKKGSWLGDFFNQKYNYISYSNEIDPDSKEKIIGKYGAIWTDKGLIYVAKMSDKGELELL